MGTRAEGQMGRGLMRAEFICDFKHVLSFVACMLPDCAPEFIEAHIAAPSRSSLASHTASPFPSNIASNLSCVSSRFCCQDCIYGSAHAANAKFCLKNSLTVEEFFDRAETKEILDAIKEKVNEYFGCHPDLWQGCRR